MRKHIQWSRGLLVLLFALTACVGPFRASPTPSGPTPTMIIFPTSTPNAGRRVKITPGSISIVTLGDSLTQGDGDESGMGGYPNRLAQRIDTKRPGTTVLNLGRSGWTSKDLLNGVDSETATVAQAVEAKADIVLVWIGSNDLWYLYEYGPEPMAQEAERQDLRDFTTNINIILGQLKASGANVFIALLDDQSLRPVVANPPNPSEPAFSAITKEDLALMSVHVIAMNRIIKQRASVHGAITVNFDGTNIFTNSATLYSDGNHPNTAGYEMIAQIWFLAIDPHLK